MKQLVALMHGFLLRSDLPVLKYWGRIPYIINSRGYDVAVINNDAFGSITGNVGEAAKQLFYILERYNYEAIHIIGHSKGGVEAAYLLNNKILRPTIKTVVMLNSPLRGQNMAVKMISRQGPDSKIYKLLNLLGRLQGDKRPDSFMAFKDLSEDHLGKIDVANTSIYYVQSRYEAKKLNFPWNLIALKSYGCNFSGDGLVEYKSLSDSSIREIPVESLTNSIVTHNSVTGLPRFIVQSRLNIFDFWTNLLSIVFSNSPTNSSGNGRLLTIKNSRKNMPRLIIDNNN